VNRKSAPKSNDPISLDDQLQALELLRSIVSLLHRAIEEYIAARLERPDAIIDGSAGAANRSEQVDSPGVGQIIHELLAAKEADGLSERYIQTIRSHLVRFAANFKSSIGSITASQMETWLRAQSIGPRARNNIRSSIVCLFHFARKQGYLTKGEPTEADELAKAKDCGGKIGILKPEELARLLADAPERIALFFALGAFTGMRSSEILRLDWLDLNFERCFITVAPEKAKTATRRLVPILSNLMEWLAPYRSRSGRVFFSRRDADRAIAFAKNSRIDWPNNALRHSYATYRLALTADAARVALEMGNSPQKLIRNYRELADEKEAQAWFSILPPPASRTTRSSGDRS
jgi:integrase